jgi:glutamate synthase domain-containing protein 3
MLQVTHMHASPDGPWFFLIAQSDRRGPAHRLIGITDTSMLRPQVFALQEGDGAAIGFAASEKQAIDAALASLADEDSRFWSRADRYWNARGGSHTDGGAFLFTVQPDADGKLRLACTDKFGRPVHASGVTPHRAAKSPGPAARLELPQATGEALFQWALERIPSWTYDEVRGLLAALEAAAQIPARRADVLHALTRLADRRYPIGEKRRSSLLALFDACFARIMEGIRQSPGADYAWVAHATPISKPAGPGQTAIVEGRGFSPEGADSVSLRLKRLYATGFRRFIVIHAAGHRFIGNGFGPQSEGVRLDVHGSPGDYLASGMDGMEIHVHNNGQDQLAQIMKSGKLVVHGDVGQTFMYGAKGGEAYVLGNAAGRPLINAVGRPRVVINGTALDYLAESFMAGDALHGGGFVILNGIRLDEQGKIVELDSPYPGGNLFSLASGGAIYVRDPHQCVSEAQLNGGEFAPFTSADWELILPYLQENERLFGVALAGLLQMDGQTLPAERVYRKIQPHAVRALLAEEAWVNKEE